MPTTLNLPKDTSAITVLGNKSTQQEALTALHENFDGYIRFIAERTYLQPLPHEEGNPLHKNPPHNNLDNRLFSELLLQPSDQLDLSKESHRTIHGVMHAARTTAYTKILHNLKQKTLNKDGTLDLFAAQATAFLANKFGITEYDIIMLTQIATFFHDSAREGEGVDYWDHRSSENCFEFLSKLGINEKAARFFAIAARDKTDFSLQKDAEEKTKFETECLTLGFTKEELPFCNYPRDLVGFADMLDVMRVRDEFIGDKIDEFLNGTANPANREKTNNLMLEVLNVIEAQGDLQFEVCTALNQRTKAAIKIQDFSKQSRGSEFEQSSMPYTLMELQIGDTSKFLNSYLGEEKAKAKQEAEQAEMLPLLVYYAEEIIKDPSKEELLYQNILEFFPQIALKSIRFDEKDFWGSFVLSVTQEEQLKKGIPLNKIRKQLRAPVDPLKEYKVDERGLVLLTLKKYTSIQKGNRSKPQSATIGQIASSSNPSSEFMPPVFEWNIDRNDELVGVIFFSKNFIDDPNLLVSTVMKYNNGTYSRPNRFITLQQAKEYYKSKKYDAKYNTQGTIFKNPQELFKYGSSRDYNETLIRMKWTKDDPRCQIGIFKDNLQSRLIAQFRAMDIKINFDTKFVPISFYLPNSDLKIRGYTLAQQQQDLQEALKSEDVKIRTMALIIDSYNSGRLLDQMEPLTPIVKKEIISLLNSNKISVAAKFELLKKFYNNSYEHLCSLDAPLNFLLVEGSINYLVEDSSLKKNKQALKMLINAIKDDNFKIIEYLVTLVVNINLPDKDGNIALIEAVKTGSLEIVKYLIEKGANINLPDKDGNIALMEAVKTGSLELVKYLIERGANINSQNNKGDTALMLAINRSKGEIFVKHLIEQGANINLQNNKGETALVFVLNKGERLGLNYARYLIEKGANINLPDKDGNTLLIAAVKHRCPKIVKYLAEQGADLNLPNKDGNTALIEVVKNIIDYLVEQKNNKKDELLPKDPFDNAINEDIFNDCWKILEHLVDHKVDINLPNKDGNTILMLAAIKGCKEVVQFLVEKCSANINISLVNKDGDSALKIATDNNHSDIVIYLKGASSRFNNFTTRC